MQSRKCYIDFWICLQRAAECSSQRGGTLEIVPIADSQKLMILNDPSTYLSLRLMLFLLEEANPVGLAQNTRKPLQYQGRHATRLKVYKLLY
jgi:hypothetical protein